MHFKGGKNASTHIFTEQQCRLGALGSSLLQAVWEAFLEEGWPQGQAAGWDDGAETRGRGAVPQQQCEAWHTCERAMTCVQTVEADKTWRG